MAKYTVTPIGVCSKEISFELEAGVLRNVRFVGGCSGNLLAIGRLVEGMRVEDALRHLKGIPCGKRRTSCSDQLARAMEKAMHNAPAG